MGAVYLAERADDAYEKRVAIKMVWPGGIRSEINRRFNIERRVLAALEHPNIARLLDGGVTEDGWSYVVMEYVDGVPITEYCDRQKLSIAERLKLFQSVCEAVQYAHQNLIVHRDLKPSNILVTNAGEVKLLDFGIAKILDPTDDASGQSPTLLNFLTPEYASPEHIAGQRITTASDVYSLGVLLYELLTGARPFNPTSRSPQELIRLIETHEPARPSQVSVQLDAATRKQLRGDLDNIILKALQKEPLRRYQSARQFSEDIARHLNGEPVIAREATLSYRLGKFTRRNSGRVAILFLVLLALLGVSFYYAQQAKLARAEARRQRQEIYASRMQLAAQELDAGNLARARDLVEQYFLSSSQENDEDWRGFEWYALWHATHTGLKTIRHPGYDFDGDVSPDGKKLFLRSRSGEIVVYDLQAEQIEFVLANQGDWIAQLDVSRDGRRLAASGRVHGVVRVWDISTRRALCEINAHDNGTYTVALSPDGKLLATGSIDGSAKIWDVETGQLLHDRKFERWVRYVAFSSDGKQLAFASAKAYPTGVLTLLNAHTFQITTTIELSSALQRFQFSSDGKLLVGAPRDGKVRVWEVDTQKLLHEFSAHQGIVWDVAFSPDNKLVASRGDDGNLSVSDLTQHKDNVWTKGYGDAEIMSVAFLPNQIGNYVVVTCGYDGTTFWNLAEVRATSETAMAPDQINAIAISLDGRLLASTGRGFTKLWTFPNIKELAGGYTAPGDYTIAFSPDGRWLVTGSGYIGLSGLIRLREAATGEVCFSWQGHGSEIKSAAFSPDGRMLATVGDSMIKVWGIPSGQLHMQIKAHNYQSISVAFSPDGRRLVSGGYDALAKVWDVINGRELLTLNGHPYQVNAVLFSPQGNLVATASADHLIKLWDATNGREIHTLIGHSREVKAIAFSPDGSRLASAGMDRTVRIWDVESGLPLTTFQSDNESSTSIAFSPDGKFLIAGGTKGTLQIWRAATEEEIRALPIKH
ncbi:MAG: protein kinase [Acidobacteriota bacterium]|nr:protein kinase [Acidobacteriota bacterium]